MGTKEVKGPTDMPKWLKSEAFNQLISFIELSSRSVAGLQISDAKPCPISDRICDALSKLDSLIDECPPQKTEQRYGNKAFRDWYSKVKECSVELVESIATGASPQQCEELRSFVLDSFGNSTRIDYGTGHEAAFVIMLSCLHKINIIEKKDLPAIVLNTFGRYLDLVRRLQTVYQMEPAGSQGVWSLDDHQFVPYIWGAAQLIDHPTLTPNSFLNETEVEQNANQNLFFRCIQHINSIKTGPFAEHSNQLWNISGVPSWSKVNSGLVKMYRAEVLSKFPVVQHFVFGDLFSINPK